MLRLQGRVHGGTADRVRAALLDAIDGGERRFVLDCSGSTTSAAPGVRVLSVVSRQLQNTGGRLVLFGVNPNVQDILNITGLAAAFPSFETETDALQRSPERPEPVAMQAPAMTVRGLCGPFAEGPVGCVRSEGAPRALDAKSG